ncbi:hypothetical protein [Flavobacterium sp. UMI-01]|uniref:hypothetical protein n=1 Tax=Flavobacterium sp. UMI-01 TaxID=1441053 RepID=UPI001C7D25EF|nr:hypothetical protein [Flavobacterium sp. UMI-01]GIZ08327.1 hypothetical protein FUMI01_10540 [Flavobacterium sp. UMI-01]
MILLFLIIALILVIGQLKSKSNIIETTGVHNHTIHSHSHSYYINDRQVSKAEFSKYSKIISSYENF